MKRFTFRILILPLFSIINSGCHQHDPQILDYGRGGGLEELYEELRAGYGEGDTLKAQSTVRAMLEVAPIEEANPQQIRLLNNGLLQLMYTYIYAERPESGFLLFRNMADRADCPLRTPGVCRRKVLICTAYLGMQCGEITKAVSYLEEGLQLPEYPTADERYADFTFAGAIYSQAKGRIGSSIEMYERALTEIKSSDEQSGLAWLLGNLAELYEYNGRFEEAVKMNFEALDCFKNTGDDEGISSAYYSLSQLHRHLDMQSEARGYTDAGLAYARRSDNIYYVGLFYLEQYEQALQSEQPDSARYWLERADSCFVTGNNRVEHLTTQTALAQLLFREPGRLDEGIGQLEKLRTDTLLLNSPYHALISAELGQGLLRRGQEKQGVRLLESALSELETDKRDVLLLEVYSHLAAHFRRSGDYDRALLYMDKWKNLREELFQAENVRQVAASRIRYETTQKELENKLLHQQTVLQRRTILGTWLLSGLLVILLVYIGLHLRQRQKHLRKISEARLARIATLLDSQQKMKTSCDYLTQQNERLSQELLLIYRNEERDKILKGEFKSIFSQNEEANFRLTFMEHYPNYLPTLRQRCPDLTRTDELIAILLLLNQSNDEIALTLNITKASVNKARTRMRKRLGLSDTGIILEDFLKGFI